LTARPFWKLFEPDAAALAAVNAFFESDF